MNLEFLGRYSTVNEEKTVNAAVELQFEKIASFTSVSHSSFGDLHMGESRRHGFDNWGLQYEYSNNSDTFYNEEPVINTDPSIQRNVGYQQTDFLQKLLDNIVKQLLCFTGLCDRLISAGPWT